MMRRVVAMSIYCLSWICTSTYAADESAAWTPLFDGKTLTGWRQLGGNAKFTVEDGAIVGTSVPNTPNSFLCTEKNYGDFILELEFKVDSELNSGVQIRSNSLADYQKGRVHGYQVEIDPSDRAWTGGIYDEGRRGWLNSLAQNDAARYAFKPNEWNQFRIQAIGDSIKTWLNGVPAADLVDSLTQTGFIGLQVHGVGGRKDPLQVRWRNIRIKDLGQSTWKPLFDGESLSGWSPLPGGKWTVEDGVIRGTSPKSERRHGILLTDATYADFTARVKFRVNAGDSGFYFRAEKNDSNVGVHGFQVEVDTSYETGGLYETGGRAWVVKLHEQLGKKAYRPGAWNEITVSAHGRHIVVHLNGTKTAELLNDPGRTEGHFGLQLHGGQDMDVEYKAVDLLACDAERPADEAPATSSAEIDLPVVPQGAVLQKVADGFKFTEGPARAAGAKLFFSDIPNERIHVLDTQTDQVTVHRENSGRANGLMVAPSGALYACEGGNRQLTRQQGESITVLADRYEDKRLNSPNDLVFDGKGGLYFTDPRYGNRDDMEMDVEGVYYLPRRGKLRRVIDNLQRPNGLILAPDRNTLYVADNAAKTIWAYTVQGEGALTGGKVFAEMDLQARGGGDGMTIDRRGNVYCAGQGHIWIWDPQGKLITKIPVPEGPANCVFAGPENKTLYVTARTGLYRIKLNVPGA